MSKLDQFYTKPYIAKLCYNFMCNTLQFLMQKDSKNLYFIEPSAGEGCFFDLLPESNRTGVDLDPKRDDIIKHDFLTWAYRPGYHTKSETVIIGNPPFGHRANIAIEFFNRSAKIADTIGFILPVQFRKYSVHKKLNTDFKWINKMTLPPTAFYTDTDSDYRINTEFQIWTRLDCRTMSILRLYTFHTTSSEYIMCNLAHYIMQNFWCHSVRAETKPSCTLPELIDDLWQRLSVIYHDYLWCRS